MGRYTNLYSDMWTDKEFQESSDSEKLAFIYAMTSPMGNQAGFYRLPPSYVGLALKKEMPEALQILSSLSEKALVKYDIRTETILVPNYLKYNTAKSLNQYKGLNSCIKAIPFSLLHIDFFYSLCKHCPDAIKHLDEKVILYVKGYLVRDGSTKAIVVDSFINNNL